jgi:hypothetical protein
LTGFGKPAFLLLCLLGAKIGSACDCRALIPFLMPGLSSATEVCWFHNSVRYQFLNMVSIC